MGIDFCKAELELTGIDPMSDTHAHESIPLLPDLHIENDCKNFIFGQMQSAFFQSLVICHKSGNVSLSQ